MYIDGEWVRSSSGGTFEVRSPASGEVIYVVQKGTRDDARKAIDAGQVLVNESTTYWEPQEPFGGLGGKKSDLGRLGGVYAIYEMSNFKTTVIDKS